MPKITTAIVAAENLLRQLGYTNDYSRDTAKLLAAILNEDDIQRLSFADKHVDYTGFEFWREK